jgi:choline dehydrogenase-like flavoprotein
MANLNIEAKKKNTYDAIVVGSGISGGWAAKELTQKGLKTLVLERGRMVNHITDYPTAMTNPWEFPHHGKLPLSITKDNPVISRCYAFDEATQQFFVKDTEHPYVQDKPFDWIRGYQVGGKSLLWARQVQRWSDFDFEGPARDGYAVDWPIRYKDIAPWYSYVEKFAGISGNKDGLESLPDGEFQPAMPLNAAEKHLQASVAKHYKDRHVITARCAHLTQPTQEQLSLGRSSCQYRNLCYRGCPYGGYFSSNSATLPAAMRTKKLTIRPNSVVESIIFDEKQNKAVGVRVVDSETKETIEFYAKVFFIGAACLNTNLLLLNSTSNRFPNGIGNDSGVLGKYLAFHNYRARVTASLAGFEDVYYAGRRPTAAYMPRYRNLRTQETDFIRGWATYIDANRPRQWGGEGFGAEFKDRQTEPADDWTIFVMGMMETIPKATNFVSLDAAQKDAWGVPLLKTSISYDDNDEKMIKDYHIQTAEMLEKAGFKDIQTQDTKQAPGLDIHEMGGCRMGKDPKTAMLNSWNQMHAVKNVFVTDGASMVTTSTQNPSLTFMALTARAADYAVKQLKTKNL